MRPPQRLNDLARKTAEIPSFSRGFDLNNKKTPSGGRWRAK
jgi:hypothetical protein